METLFFQKLIDACHLCHFWVKRKSAFSMVWLIIVPSLIKIGVLSLLTQNW